LNDIIHLSEKFCFSTDLKCSRCHGGCEVEAIISTLKSRSGLDHKLLDESYLSWQARSSPLRPPIFLQNMHNRTFVLQSPPRLFNLRRHRPPKKAEIVVRKLSCMNDDDIERG